MIVLHSVTAMNWSSSNNPTELWLGLGVWGLVAARMAFLERLHRWAAAEGGQPTGGHRDSRRALAAFSSSLLLHASFFYYPTARVSCICNLEATSIVPENKGHHILQHVRYSLPHIGCALSPDPSALR